MPQPPPWKTRVPAGDVSFTTPRSMVIAMGSVQWAQESWIFTTSF